MSSSKHSEMGTKEFFEIGIEFEMILSARAEKRTKNLLIQ